MLPQDRLDQIAARFEFLEAQLNAGPAADQIARISREYAELKPVVAEAFPFDRAPDAHRFIEERRNVGKVVLVP